MTKQKTYLMVAFFLLLVTAPNTKANADMKLKFATPWAKTHPACLALDKFGQYLTEYSEGKIAYGLSPGGAVVTGTTALDMLAKGIVDVTNIYPGYYKGELPLSADTGLLPFVYSVKSLPPLLEGRVGEIFNKEFENNNIKLMLVFYVPTTIFTSKPMDPDTFDLSGRRIRSPGAIMDEWLKSLGASVVSVPAPEIPVALRTGMIDSVETSYASWDVTGIMRDVPYAYVTMDILSLNTVSMSLKLWNSLSTNERKVMLKAAKKAQEWAWEDQARQDMEILKKAERDPNVHVIRLTGKQIARQRSKALELIYKEMTKRYGARGSEFVNAAKDIWVKLEKD